MVKFISRWEVFFSVAGRCEQSVVCDYHTMIALIALYTVYPFMYSDIVNIIPADALDSIAARASAGIVLNIKTAQGINYD